MAILATVIVKPKGVSVTVTDAHCVIQTFRERTINDITVSIGLWRNKQAYLDGFPPLDIVHIDILVSELVLTGMTDIRTPIYNRLLTNAAFTDTPTIVADT